MRGRELESIVGKTKVLLFNAKPEQWVKKQDHAMTALKPLFCVPMRIESGVAMEREFLCSMSIAASLAVPAVAVAELFAQHSLACMPRVAHEV